MIWINHHKPRARCGRPVIDRMARPGNSEAGRRVDWQVAVQRLALQGKAPGHQGQERAEENPRPGALQAELTAENRLNLLAESWLIQFSFLENPHRRPPVAFHQPPEGEADKGCPSE